MILTEINEKIQELPEQHKNLVSDGYHTFRELYDHRVKLFVALCNTFIKLSEAGGTEEDRPWKSKLHADGTMWDGWFIAGIGYEKGGTLTYHLPMSEWDKLNSDILENAPEWDGHTSDDVLLLLSKI